MQQASRSQPSTFGRASSTSQLKKGLAKLPPLPKQPETFDNLYVKAKKRASAQKVESRKVAIQIKSPTTPASSRIHQSRSLSAFALDTQEQPDPEEQAWASDILASVPMEDPELDVSPDRRAPGMEADAVRLPSKARSGSKQRVSVPNVPMSASAVMASQIANPSEDQPDIARRSTRETAAQSAALYIQALRQMMDSDGDWGKDGSVAQAAMSASEGGGIASHVQFNVQGFSESEVKRMRIAFMKFKALEGQEIHKDDLAQALTFLGYMKVSDEVCHELADQITTYSLLDWEEYNDFMEKFRAFERDTFFAEFDALDVDGSGQLSMKELKVLISGLGVTPLRETLSEAMAIVDSDGSGNVDFEEFVHLMAVYRVTEGFTRDEVSKLKVLFDRVAVHVPGGPREVKADRLGDALTHMFGPQAAGLAQKLARRFDPAASLRRPGSASFEEDHSDMSLEPSLPFPEFLLWCRRLREAEIEEYHMHFEDADGDSSGRIGPEEMRQVITNVGYMPLRSIVNEVLDKVDVDGDRQLDFEEFVHLMAVFRKTDGFCAAEVDELTVIFNDFKHTDEDVDCMELMDMLRNMGYVTSLDAVRQFIKQVDIDNTNSLDLPEFIRLMRMHREVELNQALKAFNKVKQDSGLMKKKYVSRTLDEMGYCPTEEMLAMAMQELTGVQENASDEKEEKPPPAELDFDEFVEVLDICRKQLSEMRRKMAGYSDEEVNKYSKAFKIYDEDGSGDIEKHELTNLLNDLGIPMRSKAEQKAMLAKLDVARARAKTAGVEEELLGEMGDPSVTFSVLLFLVRMLSTAADQAEVDRDRKITESTHFSLKEAQDFREIFVFWCNKSAALNNAQEAPDVSEKKGALGGKDAPDEQARNLLMNPDGCRRVVKSLGLQMSPQDRKELDERLEKGPTSPEAPGKYGFFEFLLFMRWVLDNNFGNLHETCAMAAGGSSPLGNS